MDTEQKKYEIAYLVSSDISEEEVFGEAGKITTAIQDAHGLIDRIEEPKKRRLAYPIKKNRSAYFGWTTFTLAPEKMPDLKKTLDASKKTIFRCLITEIPKRRPAPQRYPKLVSRPKAAETIRRPLAEPPAQTVKPEEKMNIEELDKKLEEILGK